MKWSVLHNSNLDSLGLSYAISDENGKIIVSYIAPDIAKILVAAHNGTVDRLLKEEGEDG